MIIPIFDYIFNYCSFFYLNILIEITIDIFIYCLRKGK